MARTVDPAKHRLRRMVIIDAALTRFAADGYEGATTAAICREAGIGSGTFFHYFPTKISLLLAILELGRQETQDWFADQVARTDAGQVLEDYVRHRAGELAEPRVPGFVRAVGAVMGNADIARALDRDDEANRAGLEPWVHAGQQAGAVRTDVSAERLTQWLLAVVDGLTARLSTGSVLAADAEQPMLLDVVARLLRP